LSSSSSSAARTMFSSASSGHSTPMMPACGSRQTSWRRSEVFSTVRSCVRDPQLLREPHAVPLRLGEHWGDVVLQHGRQRLDGELKPTSGWDGEPGIRGRHGSWRICEIPPDFPRGPSAPRRALGGRCVAARPSAPGR
jgi:hypothetical protein